MTETTMATASASNDPAGMSSDRLARFEQEVAGLKSAGGVSNPERIGSWIGIAASVVGAVIAIIGYAQAQSATRNEYIFRYQILAGIGLAVAIAGAIIWLRNSMTRYLRWWLIRLVFEQREQAERIVDALRDR